MNVIRSIQAKLSYNALGIENPQFRESRGGMMGTTGFLIGAIGGIHFGVAIMIVYIWYSMDGLQQQQTSFLYALLHWCIYATMLCLFHFMEFLTTALYQPQQLTHDSFITNHSIAYTMAAIAAWIEYILESYFFPQYKHNYFHMIIIGLILVIIGQFIRSIAMWTCGKNFSHRIMYHKRDDHELVTTGIYSILRHPSYFGWFYWSIGTQILLCNPICFILYLYASWSFFKERIPDEEKTLKNFYKDQYVSYCKRTYIGIPFISSTITTNSSYSSENKSEGNSNSSSSAHLLNRED